MNISRKSKWYDSAMIQVDILCIITLITHTNLIDVTFHALHHNPNSCSVKIKRSRSHAPDIPVSFTLPAPDTFSW